MMEEMEHFEDLDGIVDGKIDNQLQMETSQNFLYTKLWGLAKSVQNHTSIKSNTRAWTEFLFPSHFKKPTTASIAFRRLQRNIRYFWANYFIFALGFSCLWLLTKPFTLVVLLCITYFYFYTKDLPISLCGKTLPANYQSQFISFFTALLIVYFVGPAAFSSFTIAGFFVCLHGVFYDRKEYDTSNEEEEMWNTLDPDTEFPGV